MEAELGLTRRSKFGFPPPPAGESTHTVRAVPLTAGVQLNQPWPLLPPGSATSMTNFLPLDGKLAPRSRLSSLNTINVPGNSVIGLQELTQGITNAPMLWYSGTTVHGVVTSNGSISRASFVSSFGLGVSGLASRLNWQYAPIYSATLDANMLMAVGRGTGGSADTILVLYQTGGSPTGQPLYSYLTSAPKAAAVTSFDNYAIAFNIGTFGTRVQWCVRGDASNWTSEGSGFEDLLQMRGVGMAVRGTADGRVVLWSDNEIWYGASATYPMQFQFFPLDTTAGCPFPQTIAETDMGFIFLGSDLHLRLLPKGGGLSQVIAPSLSALLMDGVFTEFTVETSWAVFDPRTRCYLLYVQRTNTSQYTGIALNVDTGEWGFLDHPGLGTNLTPVCGATVSRSFARYVGNEGLMFGTSTGTVCSTNSKLGTEFGSVVTSKWQSAPIAADLPGNYKQLTQVDCDHRSTRTATITLKVSQDGGNSFGYTAMPLSLLSAPVSGRATTHLYAGGGFPAIELSSTDTGYELHRLDVTMQLGGRR
jgi:hypothetical protein